MDEGRKVIGFLVNPKAGYGILMNRPGSDSIGHFDPHKSRSVSLAVKFLEPFLGSQLDFMTAGGYMGEIPLRRAGFSSLEVIYRPGDVTTSADTVEFVRKLNGRNPDILVFLGGDGTASDIASALSADIPVIGVPAGVKMHSSVFAISVDHSRQMFSAWLSGSVRYEDGDVVDADEAAMLEGRQCLAVKGYLKVPVSGHMILTAKREYESTDIMGAVEYIIEKMENGVSYVIGSGSTCKAIVRELGFSTPFYGVDVIMNGKLVKENADSSFLTEYVSRNRSKIILTPIGGQGFIVGRGNRQINDDVLKNIGEEDLIVISSAEKIRDLDNLILDSSLWKSEYVRVIYDYGRFRMVRLVR